MKKLNQGSKILMLNLCIASLLLLISVPFINTKAYRLRNNEIQITLNDIYTYVDNEELLQYITDAIIPIYANSKIRIDEDTKTTLSDVLLTQSITTDESKLSETQRKEQNEQNTKLETALTSILSNYNENEIVMYANYGWIDSENHVYTSGIDQDDLTAAIKNENTSFADATIDTLFVCINFDEKGNISLHTSTCNNSNYTTSSLQKSYENSLQKLRDDLESETGIRDVKLQPITSTNFLFAVPLNEIINGNIDIESSVYQSVSSIQSYSEPYFFLAYSIIAFLLFGIMFNMPSKKMRESKFVSYFDNSFKKVAIICIEYIGLYVCIHEIGSILDIPESLLYILLLLAGFMILFYPIALIGIFANEVFCSKKKGE